MLLVAAGLQMIGPQPAAPGVADQLPRDEVLARLKPWLSMVNRKKVLQTNKIDLVGFRRWIPLRRPDLSYPSATQKEAETTSE